MSIPRLFKISSCKPTSYSEKNNRKWLPLTLRNRPFLKGETRFGWLVSEGEKEKIVNSLQNLLDLTW